MSLFGSIKDRNDKGWKLKGGLYTSPCHHINKWHTSSNKGKIFFHLGLGKSSVNGALVLKEEGKDHPGNRYDTSKNCLSKKSALKRKRNPTWSRWHWLHWLQSGPYTRPGRGIWRASRKAPGLHCWTNIKWRSLPSQQWSRQSTRQQRRRRRRPSRWATAYRRSSQSSPGPWWSSRPGRGSPQCWRAAGGLNYCENLSWGETRWEGNLSSKSKSKPKDNDACDSIGDIQSLHPGVLLQHLEGVANLSIEAIIRRTSWKTTAYLWSYQTTQCSFIKG